MHFVPKACLPLWGSPTPTSITPTFIMIWQFSRFAHLSLSLSLSMLYMCLSLKCHIIFPNCKHLRYWQILKRICVHLLEITMLGHFFFYQCILKIKTFQTWSDVGFFISPYLFSTWRSLREPSHVLAKKKLFWIVTSLQIIILWIAC